MALTGPELFQAWFEEFWNKGQAEAIDKYAAPGWVGHGTALPGDPGQSRRDRLIHLNHAYRSAFPDISFRVEHIITDGDFVAGHLTVRATHTGDGLGFPPTGRDVQFSGTVIVRRKGDQFIESWESWNLLDMYEQLGRRPA